MRYPGSDSTHFVWMKPKNHDIKYKVNKGVSSAFII